jgi:hypothetical protein
VLKNSCHPFWKTGASFLENGCILFEKRMHPLVYTTFLPLLSAFSFAANTWFTKRHTERGRFSSLSAENRRGDIYFIKNSL